MNTLLSISKTQVRELKFNECFYFFFSVSISRNRPKSPQFTINRLDLSDSADVMDSQSLDLSFLNEFESITAKTMIRDIATNHNERKNMSVLDVCVMTIGFLDQLSGKFGPEQVY